MENKTELGKVIDEMSGAVGGKQKLATMLGVERTTLFYASQRGTTSSRTRRELVDIARRINFKLDPSRLV